MATGHDPAITHDDHDREDHGHGSYALGHGPDDHAAGSYALGHGPDDHDHGHDEHGHADAGGWVLIPLVVGAVIGVVLAVVFGIGADALPIV